MSDAALAATAGLLGVTLSGGFQVGLAWWNAYKDRRAAMRPVLQELHGMVHTLQIARSVSHIGELKLLKSLPEPAAWKTHQTVLSREVSTDHWNWLGAGYTSYEAVRALASVDGSQYSEQYASTLDTMAGAAIEALKKAHRAMSSRKSHSNSEEVWATTQMQLKPKP